MTTHTASTHLHGMPRDTRTGCPATLQRPMWRPPPAVHDVNLERLIPRAHSAVYEVENPGFADQPVI